jgi:multiple sugar transport system ATP-binding protein
VGSVQQLADPLTIYNRPKNRFVAGFLGSPSMNFFSGEITATHGKPVFHIGEAAVPLDDMPANWCRGKSHARGSPRAYPV